jgi:4-hydroxy-3-methylbut-2-enyl diphosphate reductase
VYVRKEIVHNRHVVDELREKGAIFVDELDEVPDDATVIFSAHGISPAVRSAANRRGLRVIDATCPLVTKVHLEAIRYAHEGYTIILVGHEDHDEVIGTMGEAPERMLLIQHPDQVDDLVVPDPDKVAYLTQTTLSVDDARDCIEALRRRFPKIVGPARDDICYATQNRQAAVKTLARDVDVVLVIGAANSSNANRLREVSEVNGTRAYLINDVRDIRPEWLTGVRRVGITAGASTPEILVTEAVTALRKPGDVDVREVRVVDEDVRFALPGELDQIAREHSRTLPPRAGVRQSR